MPHRSEKHKRARRGFDAAHDKVIMITRKNSKVLLCWVGALTGVFVVMSACSDGSSNGSGGNKTTSSSSGNAGAGGGSDSCGNGVVDTQETCDTAIAAGSPG